VSVVCYTKYTIRKRGIHEHASQHLGSLWRIEQSQGSLYSCDIDCFGRGWRCAKHREWQLDRATNLLSKFGLRSMVMAVGVMAGLAIGVARYRGRCLSRIAALPLRSLWLALLAIVLQWPLVQSPGGLPASFRVQQALFLLSQVLLVAFVWRNWQFVSLRLAGLGLACNLLVIMVNGGWMPITPETLAHINPAHTLATWQPGTHYGYSKDLILLQADTRLWFLSDIWVMPLPYLRSVAFSAGDVLLGAGCMSLVAGPFTWSRLASRDIQPG